MKQALVANLYNPHEQSKKQLIDGFVVRHHTFRELYQTIKSSDGSASGQHYLIEGQRGMGKTTLLLRLSYAVETDPYLQQRLIPIVFKEEAYYGIQRLYLLWETIARELEMKDSAFTGLMKQMSRAYRGQKSYDQTCFEILSDVLTAHSKQIILFIDNFGKLLNNFSNREYYRFYQILGESPFLRIVAASTVTLNALTQNRNSFQSLFQAKRLNGLNRQETYDLLLELATSRNKTKLMRRIITQQPSRVESLRILTGGVIRTIVLLFEIFIEHEESHTLADLNAVLDRVTPLYKSRMDDLSPPQRGVVNTIALHWEAINSKEIAREAHLFHADAMAVLHELENAFLIERVNSSIPPLYRLKERFFNIWYLMRLSQNGSQAKVEWLLRFLENWYDTTELTQRAKKYINAMKTGEYQPESAFYLTEAFVETGLLNRDTESQMVHTTKKLLQDPDVQVISEFSSNDKEFFEQGDAWYQRELYEQAIPMLLKMEQKNEHICFRLGYAFSKLDDYQNAAAYFGQAAKQGHVEAMVHLGRIFHYYLQEYAYAKRYYAMAVEKGHTDAMLQLGNLYHYNLKKYQEAEKYYSLVVQTGQMRSQTLTTQDFSLERLKKYLITSIKGDIQHPEWYTVHDFPGAKQNYLRAIKQTVSEALFQLGNLYIRKLKHIKKAETSYRMAAKTGHIKAMAELGDLYQYTLKDHKTAEKYYRMAAKKHDVSALVNLGFLYHKELQEYKKAEKCYTMAAKQGSSSAMNGLAWLYFEQRWDKEKSLSYAQQAIKLEKNICTAHTAACIYLWNNQPQEAIQLAETFMYAPEAYKTLENDILFYLTMLLAKRQYPQVCAYFDTPKLNLQERFKPIYYAFLYFTANPDYQKLPPEVYEPVEDIILQTRYLALDYA